MTNSQTPSRMTEIPRYVATDSPEIMQPSPIGAWVRWDDVRAILAAAAGERVDAPAEPSAFLCKAEKALEFALDVVRSYEEGGECSESGEFIKADLAEVRAAIAAVPADAPQPAKAPTLLEACQKAEEWLSGWASAEPYLSVIRSAIANATDPQPAKAAEPLAWSMTVGGAWEAGPYLVVERVDDKGWNAVAYHRDPGMAEDERRSEVILISGALEQCKAACEAHAKAACPAPVEPNLLTAVEEALASLDAGMVQGAADTLREALAASPASQPITSGVKEVPRG